MNTIDVIFIAIGLAMDAFTVAMAVSLHLAGQGGISLRQYFRLGFHFGLFQALLPLLGWLAGNTVAHYLETIAHWVAMVLLSYIGIKLIRDGGRCDGVTRPDPTRGLSLVILSLAVSIDALATGFSLSLLGEDIYLPVVIIGMVASAFTVAGMLIGGKIGMVWRGCLAWLGGLILIGIGLKILLAHLLG